MPVFCEKLYKISGFTVFNVKTYYTILKDGTYHIDNSYYYNMTFYNNNNLYTRTPSYNRI